MPDTQENPSPPNNLHKGIPLYDIIECIEAKQLTITDTAKLLNSSKSNISTRLKDAGYKPKYLETYKSHRADILSSYQQIILNSLTPDDLQKASLSQKMMAFGILFDKERLERSQSTEIVEYRDVVRAQELIEKRLRDFEEKHPTAAMRIQNAAVSVNQEADK